jgi:O-antigen ligase
MGTAMRNSKDTFIWSVLLGLFLFALLFLARFPAFTPIANRIIGPGFAAIVFLRLFRSVRSLPPEMLFYGAFVLWSMTGMLVALNMATLGSYIMLLLQVLVLGWTVALITGKFGDMRPVFGALAATAIFAFAFTVQSRELFTVMDVREKVQLAGLLKNPNAFGFSMLVGIMGLLFYWYRARSPLAKTLLVGLTGLMGVGLIFSASRKAFLTFLLFVILWAVLCHRQYIRRHPKVVLGILLLSVGLTAMTSYVLEESYLGDRLQSFRSLDSLERKEAKRVNFYREGMAMFLESPLLGVGLGNFQIHSTSGTYSHSDFMEILSGTGLIGLVLYGGGMVLLWRRLRRLRRFAANPEAVYEVTYMQILLICHVAVGLGRPHFLDLYSMTFYSGLTGWAYYHMQMLTAAGKAPKPAAAPARGTGTTLAGNA